MTSTTMVEPTGINPENRSTAHDLLILGKLALQNPVIAQITSIKKTTLPVVGTIANTNLLLGVEGIDGIKTGTLNSAGASLLFTSHALIGGVTVRFVGVVLDGPTHPVIDAQIRSIVKAAVSGFHVVQLVNQGASLGSYSTVWGQKATATASKSASVLVWGGTTISEHTTLDPVTLGTKGSTVGTATFTLSGANSNGQSISVPLTLSTTISDPGAGWRLTHPGQ